MLRHPLVSGNQIYLPRPRMVYFVAANIDQFPDRPPDVRLGGLGEAVPVAHRRQTGREITHPAFRA